MFNFPSIKFQPKQHKSLTFWDKVLGLNTVSSTKSLAPGEFATCTNFKLNDFGELVTRDGAKVMSINPSINASLVSMRYVPISTTNYLFVVDSSYKVYPLKGSDPTFTYDSIIGTMEGATTIVPFNGKAILMDGDYLKWSDGTAIYMAYDDGEGSRGYMRRNVIGSDTTTRDLYSGATTRAGMYMSTKEWLGGRKIPWTSVDVWLSKTGSPTGNVYVRVYDTGLNWVITSATMKAENLLTTAVEFNFSFDLDVTKGMESLTDYYVAVIYAGGDSSNYVSVHSNVVSSGGDHVYYDGSWHTDTTSDVLMGVKPGLPPKASFGDVKAARLYMAGDSDNPGYLWYSNVNTALDWSTETSILPANMGYDTDGGGYVSAVDDDANSFPIGGIVAHYSGIYIIGKKSQPYICMLTGDTPAEYALAPLSQQTSTVHKTVKSLRNDVWFANNDTVINMMGVQAYGDIRTYSPGDPVKNSINDNFTDTSFAGYNAADGQYVLNLGDSSAIMFVCHTAQAKQTSNNVRYPWAKYDFSNISSGFNVTSMTEFDNRFYLGGSDGNIYRLDDSIVLDNSNNFTATLKSSVMEMPYGSTYIDNIYLAVFCTGSADLKLKIYLNGSSNLSRYYDFSITDRPIQQGIYLLCDSIQIELIISNFTAPVKVRGINLQANTIQTYKG